MRPVHLIVGWLIVGGFAALWLWGLGLWIFRRNAPRPYWFLVGFLQATLLIQGLVGIVLLLTGGRASALHYVYGVIFPVLLLLVAHVLAREMFAQRPWAPFALAAFFVFGLTLRALMTGFGYP